MLCPVLSYLFPPFPGIFLLGSCWMPRDSEKREVAAVAHGSGKAGGGDCFSEGPRAQAHLPCVGMEAGAKLTMQPCYDLLRPDVRGGGMGRIY